MNEKIKGFVVGFGFVVTLGALGTTIFMEEPRIGAIAVILAGGMVLMYEAKESLATTKFNIEKESVKQSNIGKVVTLGELTKIFDAKQLKFTVWLNIPIISGDRPEASAIIKIAIRKIITYAGKEMNLEKSDDRFVLLEEKFVVFEHGSTQSLTERL